MADTKPLTLCRLQSLFSENPRSVEHFLIDNCLHFDFSDRRCECGKLYTLKPDTAYNGNICWKCPDYNCRKKFSLNFGSWLEFSKLSPDTALKLTYCWARKFPNNLCEVELLKENDQPGTSGAAPPPPKKKVPARPVLTRPVLAPKPANLNQSTDSLDDFDV